MGQSFYTSMSGLKAAQIKLNVVADNIANMNTVGFKQSDVQFSDIYYNTISPGGAPTTKLGGTNPRQIGSGVRTAAIARDFNSGSAVTTGISTHLSIKGSGFFTVQSPNGEILYTRAGNFTLDGNGNLVLPNGYKALGTDNALRTTGSAVPVKIPTLIQTETVATPDGEMLNTKLNEMNGNVSVTAGDITFRVNGTPSASINIDPDLTLQQNLTAINAELTAMGAGTASLVDGQIIITPTNPTDTITFYNGSSNFVTEVKLQQNDTTGNFESKVLDYKQQVNLGTDTINSVKAVNVDIYENGMIEVTYSNGDKLTVEEDPMNPAGIQFKYKTGNPVVEIKGADVQIPVGVVEPANLQIQFASFVNPNGLIAVGSNAYREGANSGLAMYGSVLSGAFGTVSAGEYEGSNVDLADQFAQMVISQRMLEANGRVFDASSQVLKTLTYLGQ